MEDILDQNGIPFLLSSDGTTIFGNILADTGLTPAPIKLSRGLNIIDGFGYNHGYGLLHIEAGHGQQILNAGYSSIEEFVENVAKHYDTIREGYLIGTEQTYLLELKDSHNNTLFIELSRDESYWNVNSAGIFREKYSRNKKKVASIPEVGESASAGASEVDNGLIKGETAPTGNSSVTF